MKPFLAGKKALSLPPLHAPPSGGGLAKAAAATLGARGAGPVGLGLADRGEACVETVKEGDKVVRLVVTCACGERVEIDCLYPAGI